MSLAVSLGSFIGAVLKQCAPEIVLILRAAFRDTAEDSKAPDDVIARLQSRLDRMRREQDDIRKGRDTSKTP